MEVLSRHPRSEEDLEQMAENAEFWLMMLSSPEFIALIDSKKLDESTIDAYSDEVDKRVLESKRNFKNESEETAYRWNVMREVIRERIS